MENNRIVFETNVGGKLSQNYLRVSADLTKNKLGCWTASYSAISKYLGIYKREREKICEGEVILNGAGKSKAIKKIRKDIAYKILRN